MNCLLVDSLGMRVVVLHREKEMFLACRGVVGGMWEVWVDKLQVQSDTVGLRQHVKYRDRQNTDATSQH